MTIRELEEKARISYNKAVAFFAFAEAVGAVELVGRRKTPGKRGPGQKEFKFLPGAAKKLTEFTQQVAALAVSSVDRALSPRRLLGFSEGEALTSDKVRARVKELTVQNHPDRGGDHDVVARVQEAGNILMEAL